MLIHTDYDINHHIELETAFSIFLHVTAGIESATGVSNAAMVPTQEKQIDTQTAKESKRKMKKRKKRNRKRKWIRKRKRRRKRERKR